MKKVVVLILVVAIVYFSCNIYFILNGKDIDPLGTLIADNIKLKDSGIKGEEYNFDYIFYPYYSLLNGEEQKVYKQFYANVINYEDTFVPVVDISVDRIQVITESVLNDHPELFWLDNNYYYKYDRLNNVKQVTLSFNGTQKEQEVFYEKANEIIKEAKKLQNDYDKELYVHDELMELVEFEDGSPVNQSAYSALVNGKTVCAGYSRAFQYIMMQLGIPTYYITGVGDGGEHAWNVVKLSDGYYNVDITWDDRLSSHTLFNKTDEEFLKHHERSILSDKLVKCEALKYDYINISNREEVKYYYK